MDVKNFAGKGLAGLASVGGGVWGGVATEKILTINGQHEREKVLIKQEEQSNAEKFWETKIKAAEAEIKEEQKRSANKDSVIQLQANEMTSKNNEILDLRKQIEDLKSHSDRQALMLFAIEKINLELRNQNVEYKKSTEQALGSYLSQLLAQISNLGEGQNTTISALQTIKSTVENNNVWVRSTDQKIDKLN